MGDAELVRAILSLPEPMRAMALEAGLPGGAPELVLAPSVRHLGRAAQERTAQLELAAAEAAERQAASQAAEREAASRAAEHRAAAEAAERRATTWAAEHEAAAWAAEREAAAWAGERRAATSDQRPAWAVEHAGVDSSGSHSSGSGALAVAGLHRAPIQREVGVGAAGGPIDNGGFGSGGGYGPLSTETETEQDEELDLQRLVDDVYQQLRWRLVAERERSGGWF
jgi:hypothetical protein